MGQSSDHARVIVQDFQLPLFATLLLS